MLYVLNIGLDSETLGRIDPMTALRAVRQAFGVHFNSIVVQSATEPTLVCEVSILMGATAKLHALAVQLGQDCIAAWNVDNETGKLVGPKPWGDFDAAFFIGVDGQRLAVAA